MIKKDNYKACDLLIKPKEKDNILSEHNINSFKEKINDNIHLYDYVKTNCDKKCKRD